MNRFDFDSMGDRQKRYESIGTQAKLMPYTPYVIRLDGRSFHTFTKGMKRPFDADFSACMVEATKFMVQQTNADIGYTQSDEITLSFIGDNELPFDGRISKMCSVYAAQCSVKFFQSLSELMPHKTKELPVFDCRTWNVPDVETLVENLIWRQADASRNSLTMAAHSYFKQSDLHGAGYQKKHDLLNSIGINWNDYPYHFKRGTFVKKVQVEKFLSPETLAKIPEDKRPTGPVLRNEIIEFDSAPLTQLADPVAFLFS